jgi:acetylornithine deacetylase/succinyl-diaminopimelate desuccinylase-like protein
MQYVDSRLDAAIERMATLGRLRSFASEGTATAEQRAHAETFVEELRNVGFSAGVRDTPGPPIVVGHDRSARGPSILFCGHYDAQAGQLEEKRGNKATASESSGAANPCSADQSTELMAFVEACRAWKAVAGQLPTPVSVLVVGERRLGSVRLTSILRMYADELNADIGLAPASRMSCYAAPTINSMLRGLCCDEFTISMADRNQLAKPHSGGAADPTRVLAGIIGDLHDSSGRVAIPGFYDDVDALLRQPRDPQSDTPGDSTDLQSALKLVPPVDEHEAGLVEAIPMWPTCEIESMNGNGYNNGSHTAFVRRASARLSFHLVCDQDPDVIRLAFRDFVRTRIPSECWIEFVPGSSIRPVRFDISHPAFGKARDALTTEWARQAVFICGDASPAIYALREALGMEIIVMSFASKKDFSHCPHVMPEPANYRLGIRSWARILDALSH